MATSAADAPLTVSTDGTAGPYVVVVSQQLGPVIDAMRTEGIGFRVDQDAVMLDGAPALAVINLGLNADVDRVQAILDRVADDLQSKGRRRLRSPTREVLIVRGNPGEMQRLRKRIDSGVHGGWDRRTDVEERFQRTLPPQAVAYCFSKLVPAVERRAAVLMQGRGSGMGEELHLSEVVPLEGHGQFDLDQRNRVVSDFRETFVKPLAQALGVRVVDRSVSAVPNLEELLSTEAMAQLRAFARAANKGDSHELDLQQWAGFIGQTHLDNAVVDLDQLEAWLADDGFTEEERRALVREFESGRRLLSAYDDERLE